MDFFRRNGNVGKINKKPRFFPISILQYRLSSRGNSFLVESLDKTIFCLEKVAFGSVGDAFLGFSKLRLFQAISHR
jgi:hypothetical protein